MENKTLNPRDEQEKTLTPYLFGAFVLFAIMACGLFVFVVTARQIFVVMGSSGSKIALIPAVFLGFLSLGGILGGWLVRGRRAPLLFLARLGLAAGLWTALTPFVLSFGRPVFAALGGPAKSIYGGFFALEIVFASVASGIIGLMCGAAFPAAVKAVQKQMDAGGRGLGLMLLAGFSGSAFGLVAGGLGIFGGLGIRGGLWCAALAWVLTAVGANNLARFSPVAKAPQMRPDRVFGPAAIMAGVLGLGLATALSGWLRLLYPLTGTPSLPVFILSFVSLLGMGAGGALFYLRGPCPKSLQKSLALCMGLISLFLAAPWAWGDYLAVFAAGLARFWEQGGLWQFMAHCLVAGLMVFPASLVFGFSLCICVSLSSQNGQDTFWRVGVIMAWACAGSGLGLIFGMLCLVPFLSAGKTIGAVAIFFSLGTIGLGAYCFFWQKNRAPLVFGVCVCFFTLALLAAAGPASAWKHGGIGTARARIQGMGHNQIKNWIYECRRQVIWQADNVENSTAICAKNGLSLVENGALRANVRFSAARDVMAGLVGAILHKNPKKALVLGLGSGCTAGWLARVPSIKKVDVAEKNSSCLKMAKLCAPANLDVLKNPRVRIFDQGFREAVVLSEDQYDLIIMGPGNVPPSGSFGLYTREFYESVDNRLFPGGLFCHWVSLDGMKSITGQAVYLTLSKVFPEIYTWLVDPENLLLVCSKTPIIFQKSVLKRRLESEPFARALAATWGVNGVEGLFSRHIAGPDFARTVAGLVGGKRVLSTDDYPFVAASYASTAGRFGHAAFLDIRGDARDFHSFRPFVSEGSMDWKRVEDLYVEMFAMHDPGVLDRAVFLPEQKKLAWAYKLFWQGDYDGFLAAFNSLLIKPESALELAMTSMAMAAKGDENTLNVAASLSHTWPTAADAALARFYWNTNNNALAFNHLSKTFERLGTDPWPWPTAMDHALSLAKEMAATDKALARKLYELLSDPFCVQILEEKRKTTLLAIATQLGSDETAAVIKQYGPNTPWTREFLTLRHQCFRDINDPMSFAATADIEAFFANAPLDFADTLIH